MYKVLVTYVKTIEIYLKVYLAYFNIYLPIQFSRTNYKHTSSHRSDYRGYPKFVADKYPRLEQAIAREGRPEQLLTKHHGDALVVFCTHI